MNGLREATLLRPVSNYMKRKGFRRQCPELQFYEHRIDLYVLAPKQDLTAAIELKVKDWRRALEQALVYQLCADLVYIAMPRKACARIDFRMVREYGIGIIAIDEKWRCMQIMAPCKQNVVRNHYREVYVEMILGQYYGDQSRLQ